jgi:exoribonuclease R
VYASPNAAALLTQGLGAIRTENGLPAAFSAEVIAEALAAAGAPVDRTGRTDLTALRFVTLDPASSTDLDQAFALSKEGDDYVVLYAIADLSAFVKPGGALETEAWNRASTLYLPDEKIPQYPRELSEGAASLLPNVVRPAIVMTVVLGADLKPRLRSIERALIESKAKLAYEIVSPEEAHPLLAEFAARMERSDDLRGAERIQRPEQEIEHDAQVPAELRLQFREQTKSEQANAALSLAANMAIASLFETHGIGLFRDLDDPTSRDVSMLRRTAKALGMPWSSDESLRDVLRRLEPHNPIDATFSIAVRRAGGGAVYRLYRSEGKEAPMLASGKTGSPAGPWHAAMGAAYAHATAPLRRLADRYVLDLAVALFNGEQPSEELLRALTTLPDVMARVGTLASKVERACIDLVEAVIMVGREGTTFRGVVAEAAGPNAVVHLVDEGIRVRLPLRNASPGDQVELKLQSADVAKRTLDFAILA